MTYVTVTYGKDYITKEDVEELHKLADSLNLKYKASYFVELYYGDECDLKTFQRKLDHETTKLGWMFWVSEEIYSE